MNKSPVPTERATASLINVKSCNVLLRMLLAGIRSYLKSVLRHKFVTLNTYQPDTLYLLQQGYEDHWLFFEAMKGPTAKKKAREK
jgi:hypothetical protein